MDVVSVTVAEAVERISSGATVLDVRELDEWRLGHVEGSLHVPLGELPERVDSLPETPLICVCRSGSRSLVATRFLVGAGLDAVNLDEGLLAWTFDAQPLVADNGRPTVG